MNVYQPYGRHGYVRSTRKTFRRYPLCPRRSGFCLTATAELLVADALT